MTETVAVVIPGFNAASTIAGTIHSVLAQRAPGDIEVEIIVVDDASTDDTAAAVVAMAEQYPGAIQLVRMPVNAGPAAARNAGLRAAKAKLICFLDADDEYEPGFFQKVARIFAEQPRVAAVMTDVTLVDMHRDIHPLQLSDVRRSLPSNLMVRRPIAELVGGFPEQAIFRGESAGEDHAFKQALLAHFVVFPIEDPFLRHRVRPGGHLDRYLDATRIVDGERVFIRLPPEQRDGSLPAAVEAFSDAVGERLRCAEQCRPTVTFDRNGQTGVEDYERERMKIENLPGTLSSLMGYALYRAAAFGPGFGYIVAPGDPPERAIAWLEAGTRSAARRAIIPDYAGPEPVRLLFIHIDPGNQRWRKQFQDVAGYIVHDGCVAFLGVASDEDAAAIHAEMLKAYRAWNEIGGVEQLRIYQKR